MVISDTALLERGCDLQKGAKVMAQMTGESFTDFWESCHYTVLNPQHTLWVPYGSQVMIVPREQENMFHFLYVPFVNVPMIKDHVNKDAITAYANSTAASIAQLIPSTTNKELQGAVANWFRSIDGHDVMEELATEDRSVFALTDGAERADA